MWESVSPSSPPLGSSTSPGVYTEDAKRKEETTADVLSDHKEPLRLINPGVNSGSEIHPSKLKRNLTNKTKFAQIHTPWPSLIVRLD